MVVRGDQLSAVVLVAALTGVGLRAEPLQLDLSRLSWTELDYKARKAILTATSELRLQRADAAEMAENLVLAEEQTELPPAGEDLILLTLRSKLLGKISDVRLWLDPNNARSYQRDELNSGSRPRFRAYRPMREGVQRTTLRPASGEKERPYREWSELEEKFIAYSAEARERIVSEALALFVVVSTASLNAPGDAVTLPVFLKDRVVEVRLEVLEQRKLKVDFDQIKDGETQKVTGPRAALEIAVSAVLPEGDEGTKIELLGLKGDILMTIDAESRVPLQISGKVPPVGVVNVKLTRVVLE